MPRSVSSLNSTVYAPSTPADAPSIGRRITHASHLSTTSLSTLSSLKPQSLSIPRIRILLAPYMSPFVVPMHRVETWELLHQTLQTLFSLDIFNSSIRITDHQGNSILSYVWNDLLEPDMTIIVDTCSLQAENSPAVFQTPKLRSFSPPMSPTYTIRESEDSCYDSASTYITPRGMARKALPMPPPTMKTADRGLLTRRPEIRTQNGEEEKKVSLGDMSTSVSPERPWEREREKQSITDKRAEDWEKREQKRSPDPINNKPKSKHLRSAVSRFTRAVIYVLSAGTIQSSSKEGNKRPEKPNREVPVAETPRRTITMEAIENNNSRADVYIHRTLSARRKIPISGRRGISPLPPVALPAILPVRNRHDFDKVTIIPPELAFISAESQRSKSLSHVRFPSPVALEINLLSAPSPVVPTKRGSRSQSFSSAPSPVVPTKRGSRSQSFSSARNSRKLSVGSPPRKPSLEVGMNIQHQSLNADKNADKVALQEVFDDLDGATLTMGTRSRSGTGNTAFTNVSFSPTLISLDKPLPRLPFKFSAFPAPSPPRSPLFMLRPTIPNSQEEYERPATAVARKITKVILRKVASTDFGATRRRNAAGGLF